MDTRERVDRPAARTSPKVPPWLNRTMTALLRSPFSRLVDRGIMLLTVAGRRTGRRYTFPVQYVRDGDAVWVISGAGPEKTWWRNLEGGAPVEALIKRKPRRGTAEVFTPGERPDVVAEGLRRYLERFPGTAKRLGIASDDDASIEEAVARTTIVRIDLAA